MIVFKALFSLFCCVGLVSSSSSDPTVVPSSPTSPTPPATTTGRQNFPHRLTDFETTTSSGLSTSSPPSNSTSSSPTPTPSPSPSPSPTSSPDPQAVQDMSTVLSRRLDFIIAAIYDVEKVPSWLKTIGPDGSWPPSEVDYTAGCPARRANWPAQEHIHRILTMSALWHGGINGTEQYVDSPALASAISSAMNFWFSNDYTVAECVDQGNTTACPCTTPGLWNTNWYSNVILVPSLLTPACLLFNASLTPTQKTHCAFIATRSYDTFYEGLSYLTGTNILDLAKVGIDNALLTSNNTLITEAFGRINAEVVIMPGAFIDGIKPDGSFGQHMGLLYNGNYGKGFTNDVLELEIEGASTQYAANTTSQAAFEILNEGNLWMIYRNVMTNVTHWDFSTLPRFISFPVIDGQATANVGIDSSEILQLAELWGSDTLKQVYNSLVEPTNDANSGKLIGNRNFYSNDYMVNRGKGYVSTLKMYSIRTQNTECLNTQNPFGFHLADGTLYTYLTGDEYEDIAAAWDWNLVPGTTVDYNATPLTCDTANHTGLEAFVGGASNNKTGVAVMKYLNPITEALSWQKAWFFLDDDIQYVMITNITSLTDAPVYSVLDQKRHHGNVCVNDVPFSTPGNQTFNGTVSSLWHANVGYVFDTETTVVSLSVGNRTGAWSALGISAQPPETVDLFAAWIEHQDLTQSVSYTIFPATDSEAFMRKRDDCHIIPLQNDPQISAVLDANSWMISAVFWDLAGGTLVLQCETPSGRGLTSITVNGNAIIMLDLWARTLTVSDPSQTLASVDIVIDFVYGAPLTLTVGLPTGGLAGSSVTKHISL